MIVWNNRATAASAVGWGGYAMRIPHSSLLAGGSLVRVTFGGNPTSGVNFRANNCSIGIQGGATLPNMQTPVELKFGGASGFNLAYVAGGALITSDWTPLVFSQTDVLVVHVDMGTPSDIWQANLSYAYVGGYSPSGPYYKAAAADYNNAVVSGYTNQGLAEPTAVQTIETRDPFPRGDLTGGMKA